MAADLAKKLASCRNYGEICQLLSIFPITNKTFSGALLASLDADGQIRELGRYGIVGPGPSRESVPLASSGLIAKAMQKLTPTVISNLSDHAQARKLTPSSDIDELVEANGFETAFVIPLVDHSYLYGVLGLVSHEPMREAPVFKLEQETFQALLGMAIRAVAYRNPEQNTKAELTLREQAILSLLAQDKSNQEISAELNISVSTAKAAVSEILKKLGVTSRKQAGIKARYSRLG